MSSIKMVNLMLAVEGEFDLSIPQNDITPENFRSVLSIEALLARLLAPQALASRAATSSSTSATEVSPWVAQTRTTSAPLVLRHRRPGASGVEHPRARCPGSAGSRPAA